MQVIRTFIAVEIIKNTRDLIARIQNDLAKSNSDIKFVEPDNIHITIAFLGNLEIKRVPFVKNTLQDLLKDRAGFCLQPHGLGCFPNIKNPRIIWVGIEKGGENLANIHEDIVSILAKDGIEIDAKTYHPHITIARIKSLENQYILKSLIAKSPEFQFEQIPVNRIQLLESRMTDQGPIYKSLASWELKII
ncbi:MAG: RNA 2',3'-cyclic phosphodiesterase [Candidatus Omnitrophica bacterium]|nr:RNA 2',3'-cyclic phosphodiesterase [Candidatus Omnitrophota bacterium]